mgnify:FL=1
MMYPHGLRGWRASGFPVAGEVSGLSDQDAWEQLMRSASSIPSPLSATQMADPSSGGKETNYLYDERDLLYTVTDAKMQVTAYSYDGNGNLSSIKEADTNITRGGPHCLDQFLRGHFTP